MASDPLKDPARRGRGAGGAQVDRRFDVKTVAALAVAALIIALAVANRQQVEVHFLAFTTDTPLVVVILIALVLGFVLGNLVRRRSRRARKA
ncbi:MAG TPA: LapA family protein [Solirubrobacteraceae bacterium]|nr:LapA family protein [Solirubrobacteraceae bacterium]